MVRPARLSVAALAAALWAAHVTSIPSVNVRMQTAFPAGPYLLELLETAALENSTAYFPILDRIADGAFSSAQSEEDLYQRFLNILVEDGHLTIPESLSLFKLSLSMRAVAPRIEAHYQYYETAVDGAHGAGDEGCEIWIAHGGRRYCTEQLLDGKKLASDNHRMLPFDRVLGPSSGQEDAILYADPTSADFAKFHNALAASARNGERAYRLRYRRPSAPTTPSPLPISGYGVELALKRTDYIVIDDRDADSTPLPDADPTRDVLARTDNDFADMKPLSTSELSILGLKTASFILQSDDPLDTLVRLTQDLPKFSTSIVANHVDHDFVQEHRRNRLRLAPAGINTLWVNGLQLTERQVEPFNLVDTLRREKNLIALVKQLGFSGKQAIDFLGHEKIALSSSDEDVRFDWRDDREDGKAILWLNDIENDPAYKRFPKALGTLLSRVYPGQLPPIRRNIWNLVLPVDLTKTDDIQVVTQINSFVTRGLTVRFGIVPITSTTASAQQARVVCYLVRNYGPRALSSYLNEFTISGATLPSNDLLEAATAGQPLVSGGVQMTLQEALASDLFREQVEMADHWATRLNAAAVPSPLFINGIALLRTGQWLQLMSQKLQEDLMMVQRGVADDAYDEDASIEDLLLEDAMPSRNGYIFPEDTASVKFLNVHGLYSEHADLLSNTLILDAGVDGVHEDSAALTVIADLTTKAGFGLLRSALGFKHDHLRLDVVHSPSDPDNAAKRKCPIETLKAFGGSWADLDADAFDELITKAGREPLEGQSQRVARYIDSVGLAAGENALIWNGRVIGPFAAKDSFGPNELGLLQHFELNKRTRAVVEAASDLGLDSRLTGPLSLAKLVSITALASKNDPIEGIHESAAPKRRNAFDVWDAQHSVIEVGDETTASIQLVALLNPANHQGQRWAPILKTLSQLAGVHLRIFLNPEERIKDLPVKRFYRFVLESEPSFDAAGRVRAAGATFKGLPSEALLTAAMDVPPAWFVAAKASVHDVDNIKLSSVRSGNVDATYELESIIIEGHSREDHAPPRGAQLVLGTRRDPHLTDTIIMANLGYFQFKASPGMYNIRLKDGPSADIFEIETIGAGAQQVGEASEVVLMSFRGITLYPRLRRRPGQEQADVLASETPEEGTGLLSQGLRLVRDLVGTNKASSRSDEEHAEINIFSVASGHLYERMLNIMLVSVMKHTRHTVKFWFVEQFLSPSFKEFIPHLAAAYGFRYEMVAYKWPHWLRGQSEKQREIWGYKILFLDVLFPLSLDKVIFVDADQIVRTDMYDLVRHDLAGAPYGFAPMCDSRVEMEGFRFWKQGYWANYLRGQPYHISALYVVDLRRFRALAAGDRLRQQYHALSADPNSLSNLDQDLPNHMQFSIPIHSLPQDWLWCETWCSDESLASARTIDLCNNPLTKEPKLDRARRQIPEWTIYDDEIAALDRRRKSNEGELAQRNPKSRRLDEEEHDEL